MQATLMLIVLRLGLRAAWFALGRCGDLALAGLRLLWRWSRGWAAPELAAIAGRINWREALKIAQAVAASGSLVQAGQLVLSGSDVVFIDPDLASRVSAGTAVAVGVLEFVRRRRHGSR